MDNSCKTHRPHVTQRSASRSTKEIQREKALKLERKVLPAIARMLVGDDPKLATGKLKVAQGPALHVEVLRIVATMMCDRLWNENAKFVCQALGWEIAKDSRWKPKNGVVYGTYLTGAEATIGEHIEQLDATGILRLMALMAVIDDTHPGLNESDWTPHRLMHLCKLSGIDFAKAKKQAIEQLGTPKGQTRAKLPTTSTKGAKLGAPAKKAAAPKRNTAAKGKSSGSRASAR
jgi:hypothetical protein